MKTLFILPLVYIYSLFIFSSCQEANLTINSVKIRVKEKDPIITQVKVENDQLIVIGQNLESVTIAKVEGSTNHSFYIETQNSNKLVLNAQIALNFLIGQTLNLIVSSAEASASYPISFELQDGQVTAAKLHHMGASSGQVLSFNGTTWSPSSNYVLLDGTAAMTGDFQMGNNKITGLDTPTAGTDAATKDYVDSVAGGSLWTTTGSDIYYSAGSVGIGTSTPTSKLQISGSSPFLLITDTDVGANSEAGLFLETDGATGGISMLPTGFSNPVAWADSMLIYSDNINSGGLRFHANAGNITFGNGWSPQVDRLVIDTAGNVGIGTTTPTNQLSITNALEDTEARLGDYLYLSGTSGGAPSVAFNGYYDGTGGGIYKFGHSSVNRYAGMIEFDPVSGNLSFNNSSATGNANAPITYVNRMRINSAGNVGIGTTAPTINDLGGPSRVLHIHNPDTDAGTDSTVGLHITNGTTSAVANKGLVLGRWPDGTNTLGTYENERMVVMTNALPRITILESGNVGIGTSIPAHKLDVEGDVNIGATYVLRFGGTQVCDSTGCTSSSDERLKENINPLANALEKILQIQGVEYNYIDKKKYTGKHQVGLIAQDVEKVFPEVVKTDSKTGLKSVAYDHLVAPIIEAIKELFGLTQENTREIASLKEKNKKLEEENAAIKAYFCQKDPEASICY